MAMKNQEQLAQQYCSYYWMIHAVVFICCDLNYFINFVFIYQDLEVAKYFYHVNQLTHCLGQLLMCHKITVHLIVKYPHPLTNLNRLEKHQVDFDCFRMMLDLYCDDCCSHVRFFQLLFGAHCFCSRCTTSLLLASRNSVSDLL